MFAHVSRFSSVFTIILSDTSNAYGFQTVGSISVKLIRRVFFLGTFDVTLAFTWYDGK